MRVLVVPVEWQEPLVELVEQVAVVLDWELEQAAQQAVLAEQVVIVLVGMDRVVVEVEKVVDPERVDLMQLRVVMV